ncbi:MAG: hypothetical protein ACP5PS_02785 [Bacteroidales bacterium]
MKIIGKNMEKKNSRSKNPYHQDPIPLSQEDNMAEEELLMKDEDI